MSKITEYKCPKHKSNEGYFEGKEWKCWECITSDILKYPRGRVLDSMKKDKFFLRIVDGAKFGEIIKLEIFVDNKFVTGEGYRDLSVAMRRFFNLDIKELERIVKSTEKSNGWNVIPSFPTTVPTPSANVYINLSDSLRRRLSIISDKLHRIINHGREEGFSLSDDDRVSLDIFSGNLDYALNANRVLTGNFRGSRLLPNRILYNSTLDRSSIDGCVLIDCLVDEGSSLNNCLVYNTEFVSVNISRRNVYDLRFIISSSDHFSFSGLSSGSNLITVTTNVTEEEYEILV